MNETKVLSMDGLNYLCRKLKNTITDTFDEIENIVDALGNKFDTTVNYFNPSATVDNYYVDNNNGKLVEYSTWSYFTAILEEGEYIYSLFNVGSNSRVLSTSLYYASYDSDGKYINGSGYISNNTGLIVVPKGASKTLISAVTSEIHGSPNMIEQMLCTKEYYDKNGKYTPYVGLGVLKDSCISTEIVRQSDLAKAVPDSSEILGKHRDIFNAEVNETVSSIIDLTDKPSLVCAVLTDSHYDSADSANAARTLDTMKNIKAVSKRVSLDAVIHLGDVLTYNTTCDTQKKVDSDNMYMMSLLRECSDRVYISQGNHDGLNADVPKTQNYVSYGRVNNGKVIRESDNPYYYVDSDSVKLRMIFLATTEYANGESVWGCSDRQYTWLENVLKIIPSDYNAMIFSHIAFFDSVDYRNNRTQVQTLVNSFNAHSGIFANKNGKILAWLGGHEHLDCVIPSEETGISCPQIITQCSLRSGWTPTESNTYVYNRDWKVYPREDDNVSQDCWDVMIYRPDENKIHLIRFGAGIDRDVDLA